MAGSRKLTVEILGDAKGLSGAFGEADAKLGGFAKGVVAAGAVVGAAVIGAGVALYKMGEDLDAAFDTIQIKTGASGEALEGLKDSFRAVAVETPADLQDVGSAVAGLAQRLDETHPAFNGLVEQILDLTAITGGDLNTNIDKATRLMGDWSISMDDSGAALDRVFRASQATGTSFDQLADMAVQFGSPMRSLGFTFDETVALLAQFQASGVNTELVMGSMRKALGKLATEGKDAPTALRETMQAIKDAGDASSATAMAVELFGAKAGPDMAAAIREGRFEIDALLATMNDGAPGITETANATEDAGEKFKQLKNRITIALEPLASGVFDAIGQAMDKIGPIVQDIAEKFAEHWPAIQAKIAEFVAWVDANWPRWESAIRATIQWIQDNVVPVVRDMISGAQEAMRGFIEWVQEWWPKVSEAIGHVVAVIQDLWHMFGDEIMSVLKATFETIWAVLQEAFQVIKNIFEFFVNIINGEWGAAWDNIKNIFSSVWDAIVAILDGVIQIIWQAIQGLWDGVLAIFRLAWEGLQAALAAWIGFVVGQIQAFAGAVMSVFQGIWDGAVAIFQGIWNTIVGVFSGLWGAISGFVTTIASGISGAFDSAKASIEGVFSGLGDVVKGAINTVIRAWNALDFSIDISVPDWVPGVGGKGFHIADVFPDISELAEGGIVPATPGGRLAIIGEGGHDEAVIPLDGRTIGGDTYHMEVHTHSVDVEAQFRRMEMRKGSRWRRVG